MRSTTMLCLVSVLLLASEATAELRVRKNFNRMGAAERQAYVADFVAAVKALKARPERSYVTAGTDTCFYENTYDKYVCWHARCGCRVSAGDMRADQHHRAQFLAWHREFLIRFENDLRDPARGGRPDLTLAYWNWTEPFPSDSVAGSGDNRFMGNAGVPVTQGPFARVAQWRAQDGRALIRDHASAVVGISQQNLSDLLGITYYDASPWDGSGNGTAGSSFNGFRHRTEVIHDVAHVWVGGAQELTTDPKGQMGYPPTAVDDPIFWLHHCFVDCLWDAWEQTRPVADRYLPSDGTDPDDIDSVMAPWCCATTPRSVLDIRNLVAHPTSSYRYDGPDHVAVRLADLRTAAHGGAVELRWSASVDRETRFRAFRAPGSGGPFDPVGREIEGAPGRSEYAYVDRSVSPSTEYFYKIGYTDASEWKYSGITRVITPAAVIGIHAIAPNPTAAGARIEYEIARKGVARLEICSADGKRIRTLLSGPLEAGVGSISWDGRGQNGVPLGAGTYFAKLVSRGNVISRKITLVR